MDLLGIIEQTWWLGIPVAMLAGVFLGISPLAIPINGTAVSLGAAGAVGSKGTGVRVVAAFGAGMIIVYTLIGVTASQLDRVVDGLMRPYAGFAYLILGGLILLLGVWQFFAPGRFCRPCELPAPRNPTVLGAFVAGIPGGFVNCPACAAVVTGVAGSAAVLGNPLYSGAVMLSMGLGHVAVLVGATWFLTKRWAPSARWLALAQRASAITLVLVAIYMFYSASLEGLTPGPRLP